MSDRDREHVIGELRAEVVDLKDRNRRFWEENQELRCESGWRYTQSGVGSSRRQS